MGTVSQHDVLYCSVVELPWFLQESISQVTIITIAWMFNTIQSQPFTIYNYIYTLYST